mgnify:CR=1 FL=1
MNRKNKQFSDLFLNLIVTVLIIFSINTNMVYAINKNWIEVSRTKLGRQYLDSESLINKEKGVIEISTKYLKIDTKDSGVFEENIYTMKINCITNKYKDISVNGNNNLIAKWEDPNGDKLINDVITESCKNA